MNNYFYNTNDKYIINLEKKRKELNISFFELKKELIKTKKSLKSINKYSQYNNEIHKLEKGIRYCRYMISIENSIYFEKVEKLLDIINNLDNYLTYNNYDKHISYYNYLLNLNIPLHLRIYIDMSLNDKEELEQIIEELELDI